MSFQNGLYCDGICYVYYDKPNPPCDLSHYQYNIWPGHNADIPSKDNVSKGLQNYNKTILELQYHKTKISDVLKYLEQIKVVIL